MTDRIAEITAREAAATQGTWCTYYDGATYHLGVDHRLTTHGTTCTRQIGQLPDGDDKTQAYNDATFIRNARTDVPWLLAEVRRLKGEVAQLAAENAILERALGLNEEAAA
ncbi:hypothetical protein [Streptomyces sp. NPDC059828]|uniref:hypothetical protein n=1 Tax=Streptomyces sp. NPDC059828 TaxID=3346965 RepID=UPI00364D44AD